MFADCFSEMEGNMTTSQLKNKTLAIIGMGKMGEIIIHSILKNKLLPKEKILGSDISKSRRDFIQKKYKIYCSSNNVDAVSRQDIIIIAVEPKILKPLMNEIRDVLDYKKLIISIAAGISTDMLEMETKKNNPIIRAIPTPNAKINESITVICQGKFVKEDELEIAKNIFNCLGIVEVLNNEELMNTVSALSVIPAYTYVIIEALTDGAVNTGLPREFAKKIVTQNMLGACKMVFHEQIHPAELRDTLTTPGGLTIEGLRMIEKGNIRSDLIESIISVEEKCKKLT